MKRNVVTGVISALLIIVLAVGMIGCTPTEPAAAASAGEDTVAADTTAADSADTAAADVEKAESVTEAVKAPKNGSKYVIGVSLPAPDNQWVAAVVDNAQKQAEAAMATGNFDITITTANNPGQQVSDIEDLLIKDPDAMVIFPLESAPVTPIADTIKAQGIPLIVLTRGLESSNYDSYIRGDDRVVGISAAHYIGQRLPDGGKVVMMQAAPCAITTERTEGFNETIEKYYPGIEVIATGTGNFNREDALAEMENILQANPEIDAVYSQDDEQALGCIAAIKAAGREDEMFVTGVGGNKSVLEFLMEGDPIMAATFFYSPLQGGSAVQLAQLAAQGIGMSDLWEMTIPREIVFAADTITSENAEMYYNKDSQY